MAVPRMVGFSSSHNTLGTDESGGMGLAILAARWLVVRSRCAGGRCDDRNDEAAVPGMIGACLMLCLDGVEMVDGGPRRVG
jgi:hypothetical protein